MASLITQKRSPYYWIRIYNKFRKPPRTNIPTKIQITKSDLIRIENAKTNGTNVKLQGTPEVRKMLNEVETALIKEYLFYKSGLVVETAKRLSEGFEEFILLRPNLAKSSVASYTEAIHKLIIACGDKPVDKYTDMDYADFIRYLNSQTDSQASFAHYINHVYVVFNFFIKKRYIRDNIILKVKKPKQMPQPIPLSELKKIFEYYRNKKQYLDEYLKEHNTKSSADYDPTIQYYFVAVSFLAGTRPGTTILLKKSDIHFEDGYAALDNVKGKNDFTFPAHKILSEVLVKLLDYHAHSDRAEEDNLFPYKSRRATVFWTRDMKRLLDMKVITRAYTIYQLRDTFSTFLLNNGLDLTEVADLLDHKDLKSIGAYALRQTSSLKDKIDKNYDKLKIITG